MLREQLVPPVTLQLGEQRPRVARASPSLLQALTENVPLYLLPPWLYPASLLSANVAPRTSVASFSHCASAAPDSTQPLPACGLGLLSRKGPGPGLIVAARLAPEPSRANAHLLWGHSPMLPRN